MGCAGSDLIEFVSDTDADLTLALDLTLTGPACRDASGTAFAKGQGPNKALGYRSNRCKRAALYVVDGVVKVAPPPHVTPRYPSQPRAGSVLESPHALA